MPIWVVGTTTYDVLAQLIAGGKGMALYGDMVRSLINPLQEEFLWVDPKTGLSAANEFLGPLLSIFSGEDGTILIPGEGIPSLPTFNMEMGDLLANITLDFGDIRLENVDTIGDPLALLMPVFMRPFNLENSVGVGIGERPLMASIRLTLSLTQLEETRSGLGRLSLSSEASVF